MKNSVFETLIGALVLLVALVFLVFAYKSANFTEFRGYELSANFSQAEGISKGTDVKISGISVGSVIDQTLDPNDYTALVTIRLNSNIQLPIDSTAAIVSEGLLGGRFISIDPGGDPDFLQPGEKIIYTQASPNLEQLLGKFIFNLSTNKDDDK